VEEIQESSESDIEEDDRDITKQEEDEPVVPVEFKKRKPAGGRVRRPPLRKKLSEDEDD